VALTTAEGQLEMHITLRWTACAVAAAGLLVAACGGSGSDSDDVVTGPAAPSAADVAGSDQHLRNLAEAGAADVSGSDQHLLNLGDSGLVNPFAAGNRAAARAQADQYVEQLQARAAETAEAELAQEQANAAASARLGGYAEQYAEAQAADAERQAWAQLDETLGGGSRAPQAAAEQPGYVYSGGQADSLGYQAEDQANGGEIDHQAHLAGQARTYMGGP
jgi:hypothetical protein